jgi:broad specificity phosphatase PhoE
MPLARVALLLTIWSLGFSMPAWAQQAVYVVRHAERLDTSRDSPLSAAGEARATRLAQMLSAADVEAVFITEFRRTAATAAPLAEMLGLKPTVIPSSDTEALLKAIQAQPPGHGVLVVGHSNTVPAILHGLGDDEEIKLGDNEYDNLFVLVPQGAGKPILLRFKF